MSLSPQELVDCSGQACEGGWMSNAYNYIKSKKGISTDASYKYTGRKGKCKNPLPARVAPISGFVLVSKRNDNALQAAVVKLPISVALEAGNSAFMNYKSGILSSGCTTNLDHAVLIVGYGQSSSGKYWIVKNSWGTNWGMNGYMYLARKTGAGTCGVNLEPIFPTL